MMRPDRRAARFTGAVQLAELVALLGLAGVHIVLAWGYTGTFWGDTGRWLGEIERFARGEVLYRDFHWVFPPLAMWIIGGFARLLGPDLAVIWTVTSVLFLLICLLWIVYARRLVTGWERPAVLLAGFLLAVAYANRRAAPIPMGTYTPAALVGVLFVLAAAIVLIRQWDSPRSWHGPAIGVLAGCCFLAKQDFWIPAAYLVVVSGYRARAYGGTSLHVLAPVLAAVFVGGAGLAIVAVQAGGRVLLAMLGGFGNAAELGTVAFPTWERLTVETAVAAGTIAVTGGAAALTVRPRAALLRTAAVAAVVLLCAGAVFVFMTMLKAKRIQATGLPEFPVSGEATLWYHLSTSGRVGLRVHLGILADRVAVHPLPFLLPFALVAFAGVRWSALRDRHDIALIVALLGLVAALRMRRMVETIDWFHFLFEIPLYVAFLHAIFAEQRQRIRPAIAGLLAVLVAFGAHSYWTFGRGPFTRRGEWPLVATARGVIHMPKNEAADYQWLRARLDSIDPRRERPLFAFGYSGGFNYFLGRDNPTSSASGFFFVPTPPIEMVRDVMDASPGALLLDNAFFQESSQPEAGLDRWDPVEEPSTYVRVDRPWFNRLLAACRREVGRRPGASNDPYFVLYDCSRSAQ
jgi:hypothetical protein